MNRSDPRRLLRDRLHGVHEQLETLMRGVEKALNDHLIGTERAIADALAAEQEDTDARLVALERRVAALEVRQ